jgi:glycosyltransferase involved in cell wall biosynthesis
MARSILIVKQRVPYPLDAGTDIVSYGLISAIKSTFETSILSVDEGSRSRDGARYLASEGIDVHLVPQGHNLAAQLTLVGALYRNTRRVVGGLPNILQMDECRSLGPKLESLAAQRQFDLVQFEYWTLARYRRFVSHPAVLLNHDAWHQTARSIAKHMGSWSRRLLWSLEARTVRRHELAAQKQFDWRLFLSGEDRLILRHGCQPSGGDAVVPIPFVFEPIERVDPDHGGQESPLVVFVGGLSAPFNVDAVAFFVEEIWPQVRSQVPNAIFAVVGADPPPRIRRLSSVPGVRVAGYVSDIDKLLRQAAVAVSPCRIGTGIKVKVAQAMAAGLPVVGTSVGLSGYSGADCLIRANEPEEFAQSVIELLRDEARRMRFARATLDYYREELWIRAVAPKVIALYEQMASRGGHQT